MRCTRAALLLLFVFAHAPCPADAQALSETLSSRVDSVFAAVDRLDSPGAAVAVVRDGAVVYRRGYGMANLEHGVPVTPETPFLVALVSKQFTAFAIAMLATQGRLSLDDDVRTYVPELHDFGQRITIRHLIHHTSGLRDEFELLALAGYHMDDVITKEAILDLAYRQRALNFEPGSEYLYCNTGYTLLAEIIERVTGQTFRSWTTDNLFEPLGMTNSRFLDHHGETLAGRALGYYRKGGALAIQAWNYESVGASGLFTTVEDLARWALNFETGAIGGPDVLAQVHERGILTNGDTLAYAFGQSLGYYHGHRRVSHSGSHRGFRTYLARFPDDRLSVVVLSNLDEFDAAGHAMRVADVFLGSPPLDGYDGTYVSSELGTSYEIARKGGALVATHRRYPPITLTPSDPDTFTGDAWFFETVRFTRTDGRVNGFEVTNDRTRKISFVRQ